MAMAAVGGKGKIRTISETKSGMLPLIERKEFSKILDGSSGVLKVFVESARAVARSAVIAEEAWKKSKASGVNIIPADIPALFKHDPNPGESLMRKIMCAVYEFERDMGVMRMQYGLAHKKQTLEVKSRVQTPDSKHLTQQGTVKVNGCKSVLEKLALNASKSRRLESLARKSLAGKISLRELAKQLTVLVGGARSKKPRVTIGKDTAKRMCQEILAKKAVKCKAKL